MGGQKDVLRTSRRFRHEHRCGGHESFAPPFLLTAIATRSSSRSVGLGCAVRRGHDLQAVFVSVPRASVIITPLVRLVAMFHIAVDH